MVVIFTPNIISSIGLILDIMGVILLFIYGLPSKVTNGGKLMISGPSKEDIHNNQKIERRAKLGLMLLIIGFAFQLLGTNINIQI